MGKYVPTASVVSVAGRAAEAKDDRLAGIGRLHFYSSFAWSVEQLTAFIGLEPPAISFNPFFAPRDSEAIAGWGTKARSRYAMEAAARRGLPYIALEEGFLRSVGFGQQYVEPLSLLIDPVGIYYDSTRPSWFPPSLLGPRRCTSWVRPPASWDWFTARRSWRTARRSMPAGA